MPAQPPAHCRGALLSPSPPPPLRAHTHSLQGISDVAWSSDGRMLATASDDKTLRLWDAATGRSLRTLREHTHAVFCCCFNKSGNLLVSGSYDEAVVIWDVQHGCPIKRIPAHSDPVTAVDVSSEEPRPMIASASFDGLRCASLAGL